MRRLRIIHRLRTLAALLGFCALLAVAGLLWWANQTGLPDSWRTEIEKALAAQGLHADIESLRYRPLRGIEAAEVTVYADQTRQRVVAQVNAVEVVVDRTKLARGIVRVRRLDLRGGSLRLSMDPDDPHSKVLDVRHASGRVLMPGGRRLEVIDARGEVGGIRIEFQALVLGYRPSADRSDQAGEEARLYRRQILARVIEMLEPWRFDRAAPPVIQIRVEGDLDDPRSVRADLALKGENLEHGGVALERIAARGEMRGRLLVLDSLEVEDAGGALRGRLEFDMATRDGRFDARSNLALPVLLREAKAAAWLRRFSFEARPDLELRGTVRWPEDEAPSFQITGHLKAQDLRFGSYSAARIESDLSWNGTHTFLDKIVLTRPDGTLRGRVLIAPDLVRYEVSTDLRPSVWRSLFDTVPLGKILADFGETDRTTVEARISGRFKPGSPHEWMSEGTARANHMSYRGIPFREARVTMDLDHDFLDFTKGEVLFDYGAYPLRKAYRGPSSGRATVGRVRFNREPSTLTLEGIQGDFWPAPVLRMFLPTVADHLEEYRFHRPPELRAGGVIGLFRGASKTDFRVTCRSTGAMNYRFAGKDLKLSGLSTTVLVKPKVTEVRDLAFRLFDGPMRGSFDILPESGGQRLQGELDWTRLSMPELSEACGFETKAKGKVTGRINFSHKGKGSEGLDGEGLIALEEGELFSVPIFGPLSPVLSAVLANRKVGFQDARDAFCTYQIEDGVLRTNDFLTTTPSMVFTGDAVADLNRSMLDMTIRMNARGLLGVITLPLKPFYGLFQFRGTGPLREPKWDNVMFTSPPESQKESLFDPPRANDVAPRAEEIAPSGDEGAPRVRR